MLAYHNDAALKNSVVAEMRGHREAERLIKGKYWEDGKGCAVGCLVKGNNHAEYETRFGIPRELAFLEDTIFEGLSTVESQAWPERFLNAIQPGQDLSMVVSHFLHWLLTDPEGIRKHARPDGLAAIDQIAALYARRLSGDNPSEKEWKDAAYAADAAARAADAAYAAYAAARAAARAADAAARAADAAYAAYAAARAADAAYAAARAAYAAARAAYEKQFSRMADKLIEFIASAPGCGSSHVN